MDHQAIAQMLGNYGEFIGSIAVVATLFYFSRQIRSMQHSHSSEALVSTVDGEIALDQMYVENAELIVKGNSGEELSDADVLKLKHIYHAIQSFHFHYYIRERQMRDTDIRAQAFAAHLVRNCCFKDIFLSRETTSLSSRPREFAERVKTYLNDPAMVEQLRKRL